MIGRFALYLCWERARAEDIVPETFVRRLWTASEPVRMATVKACLFAIARNLHLPEQRRDVRRGPHAASRGWVACRDSDRSAPALRPAAGW